MAKIWTLMLILTISTLFLYVPAEGQIGFILNHKIKLDYNQYFYQLCQYLIMIVLSVIIYDDAQDHKFPLAVFTWLQIADMIGFILSYDDPFKNYILTFNIIKILLFGLAIVYEYRYGK